MESKTDALLLRAVDYGENDKIVTLLTAEIDIRIAAVKGVKKAGAKLRFAAQPFCFAEYVFATRGTRNTVTSASLYDAFFPLCEDMTRYYAAAVVTDACDKVVLEGMQSGALLVAAISALEGLCSDEPLALVRFLLAALSFAGYPVEAGNRYTYSLRGGCGFPLRTARFFATRVCPTRRPGQREHLLRRARRAGKRRGDARRHCAGAAASRDVFCASGGAELPALAEYLRLLHKGVQTA